MHLLRLSMVLASTSLFPFLSGNIKICSVMFLSSFEFACPETWLVHMRTLFCGCWNDTKCSPHLDVWILLAKYGLSTAVNLCVFQLLFLHCQTCIFRWCVILFSNSLPSNCSLTDTLILWTGQNIEVTWTNYCAESSDSVVSDYFCLIMRR